MLKHHARISLSRPMWATTEFIASPLDVCMRGILAKYPTFLAPLVTALSVPLLFCGKCGGGGGGSIE